jgi:lysozyme
MPRYTRQQVRRRQVVALALLVLVVLVVIGSCSALVHAVRAGAGDADAEAEVRSADDTALTLYPTPRDASAHDQLTGDITLGGDETLGLDVSSHQGRVDWDRVASGGYGFAYLKATEGVGYTDPEFTRNWKGVHEAGMVRGAYHYFTLCSSGAEQADDFLAAVPVDDTALPPAVDLEFDGACENRPEAAQARAEVDAFVQRVEKAWGRRVVVYSSADWRQHYGLEVASGRPSWWYEDSGRPGPADWSVWQVRFDGRVPGIDGDVDVDVARPEQLRDATGI